LGAWALEEALAQVRRWEARGLPALMVSVNVSPVQLMQGELELVVQRVVQATSAPPHQLQLEITESTLMGDAEPLRARLGRLRAMGVGLSIDDFGTGYSNLGYLQRFDVQSLKIDQSFVRGLSQGAQGEGIVRAIAQLASSLGIHTVAEGIEDEATARRLHALGCDVGQGYYWSGALHSSAFMAWFLERNAGAATPESTALALKGPATSA